jgi:hypothetical protein
LALQRFFKWKDEKNLKVSELNDVQPLMKKFFADLFGSCRVVEGQGRKLNGPKTLFSRPTSNSTSSSSLTSSTAATSNSSSTPSQVEELLSISAETDLFIVEDLSSPLRLTTDIVRNCRIIVELKATFDSLHLTAAFKQRDQLIIQLELLYLANQKHFLVGILSDGIVFEFVFRIQPKKEDRPEFYFTGRLCTAKEIFAIIYIIQREVLPDDTKALQILSKYFYSAKLEEQDSLEIEEDEDIHLGGLGKLIDMDDPELELGDDIVSPTKKLLKYYENEPSIDYQVSPHSSESGDGGQNDPHPLRNVSRQPKRKQVTSKMNASKNDTAKTDDVHDKENVPCNINEAKNSQCKRQAIKFSVRIPERLKFEKIDNPLFTERVVNSWAHCSYNHGHWLQSKSFQQLMRFKKYAKSGY